MRQLTRAARIETVRTFEKEANRITAQMRVKIRRKTGLAASTVKWQWSKTQDLAVRFTAGGKATQKEPRKFSAFERAKYRISGVTVAPFDYVRALEFGTKRHRVGGMFAGAWHPGSKAFPFFHATAKTGKRQSRRLLKERWRNSIKTVGGSS